MEIKNGKDWTFELVLKFPVLIMLLVMLLDAASGTTGMIIVVCFWALFSVGWFWYDIDYMRKLVLDERGCTLILGLYKRFYTWDDLKTKCFGTYKYAPVGGRWIPRYKRCVFFSTEENFVLKKDPYAYVKPFRPLSCFCIHFDHESNGELEKGHSLFEVNEEELKSKFEEWSVKVEGFTD